MEKYQTILDEIQHNFPKLGNNLDTVLKNSRVAERMLFLNLSTGLATCRGTSLPFDAFLSESLEAVLMAFEPSYIVLLASSEEVFRKSVTATPEALRPEGIWGSSVWEVYKENYVKPRGSAETQARLKLLHHSLLLSRNRLIKQKFCNNSLVNIFGWLYEPKSCRLTDICLDVFFSFDEEYMRCQEGIADAVH